jgi:hypothetical protein
MGAARLAGSGERSEGGAAAVLGKAAAMKSRKPPDVRSVCGEPCLHGARQFGRQRTPFCAAHIPDPQARAPRRPAAREGWKAPPAKTVH